MAKIRDKHEDHDNEKWYEYDTERTNTAEQ